MENARGVVSVIKPLLKAVQPLLPLKIKQVLWEHEALALIGENWNFNSMSAWRIVEDRAAVFGCYDSDSAKIVEYVAGKSVVSIEIQSLIVPLDPVFVFSNGLKLGIFSTDTFEPWVFRTPDGGVFVASPTNPNAFEDDPLK